MKYILLLLLLPLFGYGQQHVDAPAFSRSVQLKDMRLHRVFAQAIAYAKRSTNRFYVANNEAAEHTPLLTRKALGEHNRRSLLGYESSDKEGHQVMADALMVYESADDKCIKLLVISCDVRIDCKPGAATLRLMNLKYHHLARKSPATLIPISSGSKSIDAAGSYEDLVHDDICPEEMAAINTFVSMAANKILDAVAAGMGGNLKEVDW